MLARALCLLCASLLLVACADRAEPSARTSAAPASPPATGGAPKQEPAEEKAKEDAQPSATAAPKLGVAEAQPPPQTIPPSPGSPGVRPLAAISSAAEGKVGRGELEAVVAANLDRFRPCATEDATVELEVTVSGGGSVSAVKALRSRPDAAKLRDCVVDAFRGIAFTRGAGSETSTITFELALSRPAF